MARKIYEESVKKWLIGSGISGVTLIGGIFLFLLSSGAISDFTYSGDSVCAGTIDDPCYAYINFTANEDIFLYPIGYDPYGRDTTFEFNPGIKEWKLQRSWGKGWKNIPLDKSCTGTWCGLSNSKDTRKFSIAFREDKRYNIRIVALKHNPTDSIKWAAFDGVIDPVWLPKGKKILNESERDKLRKEDSIETKNGKTKEYAALDKRLKVGNASSNIELKLITSYTKYVVAGEDVKVAEYELINYKNKDKVFDSLDFYNIKKSYSSLNKSFRFKYAISTIQEVCHMEAEDDTKINITLITICENEPVVVWTEFETLNELPKKNIIIGLFTDTKLGERVEIIPVIDDFEINEWSEYSVIIDPVESYTSASGTSSIDYIYELASHNNFLYTASGSDHNLGAFNITDKGINLTNVGGYTNGATISNPRGIAANGDYMAAAGYANSAMATFNISTHGNPVLVKKYASNPYTQNIMSVELASDGTHMYAYTCSFGGDTVSIWNVSDTSLSSPLGYATSSSGLSSIEECYKLDYADGFIYATSSKDDTLSVWNVTALSTPVFMGGYTSTSGTTSLEDVKAVSVEGDFVYTSSETDDTVTAWNISLHGNPVFAGSYTSSSGEYSVDGSRSLFVNGDFLLVTAAADSNVVLFDISAHVDPEPLAGYSSLTNPYTTLSAYDGVIDGAYGYIAAPSSDTVTVLNFSTTTSSSSTTTTSTTTTTLADTCQCPSINTNMEIDCSEYCIVQDCDIGTGNATYINTGFISHLGTFNISNIDSVSGTCTLYLNTSNIINIG